MHMHINFNYATINFRQLQSKLTSHKIQNLIVFELQMTSSLISIFCLLLIWYGGHLEFKYLRRVN